MQIDSNHFLDVFATALNTFNAKNVANFCIPPTIIMNDKSKKVITSDEELEHALSKTFANFKQASIKSFVPILQQTMRLSKSLFFSKMRWQSFDAQDQLCFNFATSHTLQKMPDKQLKIIVAVIDDDKNKLTDIFNFVE